MSQAAFRDTTRYRYGARDTTARHAHATDSREWRRSIADAEFGRGSRRRLLLLLRRSTPLSEAAAKVGVTSQRVYGRAKWDPEFAGLLEEALAEGCPARSRGKCGTSTGYKIGGQCRACRNAHRGHQQED